MIKGRFRRGALRIEASTPGGAGQTVIGHRYCLTGEPPRLGADEVIRCRTRIGSNVLTQDHERPVRCFTRSAAQSRSRGEFHLAGCRHRRLLLDG